MMLLDDLTKAISDADTHQDISMTGVTLSQLDLQRKRRSSEFTETMVYREPADAIDTVPGRHVKTMPTARNDHNAEATFLPDRFLFVPPFRSERESAVAST
jgi:hypothetical protein